MRELLYLSAGKLEQFLPERGSFWRWSKLTMKLPLGSIDMERAPNASADKIRQLDQAVGRISFSSKWFTEPDLQAGCWVQFEAPLNYAVINRGKFRGMVLFIDRSQALGERSTVSVVRLLLHGSARHLLGSQPMPIEPPECRIEPDSGIPAYVGLARDMMRRAYVRKGFSSIDRRWPEPTPRFLQDLSFGTRILIHELDAQVHRETSAWMRGYARITAKFGSPTNGCVVASPLYVEYSPDAGELFKTRPKE